MLTKPQLQGGLRILVVEDEALIAEEIQQRLARLNYEVVGIADTGPKAIAAAQQTRPDLVLMDIRLKGAMDGIEAAEQIYQSLDIPILHLTAHSDQATFQRAKAIAAFGYVLKPFQERDLLVAIEMAMHRHRLEQPLKASDLTYATILSGIAEGVIATDSKGHICFMNPAAEVLTGRHRGEAQGQGIEAILRTAAEANHAALTNPLQEALRHQQVVSFPKHLVLLRQQEEALPIEGYAAPVLDGMGIVTGGVVVLRDISDRRRMEAQIALQMKMLQEKSAKLETQSKVLQESNKQLTSTIACLAEAARRLEGLATTDGLTGLKNHRAFQERLAEECRRSQRYGTQVSLILLDVDKFKQLNDTHGHPVGDLALKKIASILQTCCRETDFAARYGGEEFAVILMETDKAGAIIVAERLRAAIEKADWSPCPLTASFGVATQGENGEPIADIVKAADEALYHSKLLGRNRVTHSSEIPLSETDLLLGNSSTPYTDILNEMLRIKADMLSSASDQIREVMAQAYDATVSSWSHLLDLKDKETEGHSQRVTKMTVRLAERIGMNAEEILYVRWGALLHDVGKMGVPDHILHKPGPLTEAEWEIMRSHPSIAYEMLSPVSFLRPAIDIPYCHHEKWDGTGYPQGLQGDNIPLAARLFAIVDVYDALTNDRPYRKALTKEQALAHIRSLDGTHFDPRTVKIFLSEFASEADSEQDRAA